MIAGPVQAKCRALLVLPDIVVAVEYMAQSLDPNAVPVAARRIDRLRQLINKNQMYQALEPEGLAANLADVMRLKVKLGTLSQIAVAQGADKARTYLRSSDFTRSYGPVRRMAVAFCAGAGSQTSAQLAGLALPTEAAVTDVRVLAGDARPADTARNTGVRIIKTGTYGLIVFFCGVIWLNRRQLRRRRREKRIACDIPVSITHGKEVLKKATVDLSRSGANLECEGCLAEADKIELDFGPLRISASVIWCNDRYAGLKFDQTLAKTEFRSLLELSRSDISHALRRMNEKTVPLWAPLHNFGSRISDRLTAVFMQPRR